MAQLSISFGNESGEQPINKQVINEKVTHRFSITANVIQALVDGGVLDMEYVDTEDVENIVSDYAAIEGIRLNWNATRREEREYDARSATERAPSEVPRRVPTRRRRHEHRTARPLRSRRLKEPPRTDLQGNKGEGFLKHHLKHHLGYGWGFCEIFCEIIPSFSSHRIDITCYLSVSSFVKSFPSFIPSSFPPLKWGFEKKSGRASQRVPTEKKLL